MFPAWDLPVCAFRLVVVVLLVGFPIALILAWAFDVTPTGIKPSGPLPGTTTVRRSRRNLWILLTVAVVTSSVAGFFLLPRASANRLEKSIAVLPFQNFSDDKENAFFADGIQDDILTNLAKIGDLKVISRTSVMPYRGKTGNVREIGKALGVSAILEGSVRKDKNRVRVNVQLINAANDQHIWAEDYDRDLTDVFAIQTDLAQKITSALQARLSPTEKAQMTRKPTESGEAYLAFVEAHNLQMQVDDDTKLKQAAQLYDRALQLDPSFAIAWAGASQLASWRYHTWDRFEPLRAEARTKAQRALQLQPDLPEAHMAQGFSYYYGDEEYDRALAEFEIAARGLPNDADVYLAIGAILRRQGRWQESNANIEKSAELSPNTSWVLQNLALNYEMLRDFPMAEKTIDRALKIDPRSFGLWEIKSQLAIEARGDFSVAEQALAEFAAAAPDPVKKGRIDASRLNLLLLQRKFDEAIRVAEQMPHEFSAEHMDPYRSASLALGIAKTALHDEAGAREQFLKGKKFCEEQIASVPNDPRRHALYANVLAWLGDGAAAVKEGRRAMELLPESKDAFEGPVMTIALAQVHATLGDAKEAAKLLDQMLSRPAPITVELLRIDPIWDRIRNDAGFAQLIEKYATKT